MERPALDGGEGVAHQPLDPGQRRAELAQVALDERGQEGRQDELGDLGRPPGIGMQVRERRLLGAARQPGAAAGIASTQRQSSGMA